ncbi:MAG TPA: hypothetical protein VGP13_03125 [Candidatus Paceibacterota bacterium]|jgi:hypothetical protein|nr:hypothetical protein [Candidatus Paceibacterota bacterium]
MFFVIATLIASVVGASAQSMEFYVMSSGCDKLGAQSMSCQAHLTDLELVRQSCAKTNGKEVCSLYEREKDRFSRLFPLAWREKDK